METELCTALALWFEDHADHAYGCIAGAPVDYNQLQRDYPEFSAQMVYLDSLIAACTCGYKELNAKVEAYLFATRLLNL